VIDEVAVALLRDTIEVEMLRLITAAGPVAYSDSGFSVIRAVTDDVWARVPEVDKIELRRCAVEFVEQYSEEVARRPLAEIDDVA
jgi:hypothetical protein